MDEAFAGKEIIIKHKRKKKTLGLTNTLAVIITSLTLFGIFSLFYIKNLQKRDSEEFSKKYTELINILDLLENNETMVKSDISSKMSSMENLLSSIKAAEDENTKLKKSLEDLALENLKLRSSLSLLKIPNESNILKNSNAITKILNYINRSLGLSDYHPIMKLIYQATVDGDNGPKFIKKIKNKDNLVIICKTKKTRSVFGGFLHKGVQETIPDDNVDNNAFLFSLTHDKMFMISKDASPYWHNEQMFFSFGQSDIFLSDEFLSNSYSLDYFPRTYGERDNPSQETLLTGGEIGFGVDELEAYYVELN